MKRPIKFPFDYTVSGLVFQIYLAPMTRQLKNGTTKHYDSFLIYHQEGAKRVQTRRATWEGVEAYVEEVVSARRKNDPESLQLSGSDRRIYLAALEEAQKLGLRVDEIVREYVAGANILKAFDISLRTAAQTVADSLRKLRNVPISTVVDFYETHGNNIKPKNVPDVVEELINELRQDNRGDYHIDNMSSRLNRFACSFAGPIHQILEREITHWLQNLLKMEWKLEGVDSKGKKMHVQVENDKGERVSERTRNNYRDAVCELFAFAKKRGYVSRNLQTEASRTIRLEVDPGKNHILTPAECAKALDVLPPHLVPFTVLKLFAGLRTEEAYKISWDELKMDAEAVVVEAKHSKLGQRRTTPLLPNAAKWLLPFQELKGRINPEYSTSQALFKAVNHAFAKAGIALKRNTFRNSYISYRLAQPTASGIVADEAGTSRRMIEQNYKALATKSQAAQWFSIEPSESKLVELKKFTDAVSTQNGTSL